MKALLIDAMGTLVALQPPADALRAELRMRFGIVVSRAEADAGLRAEIAFYRRHMSRARDGAALAALRRACAEALRAALPALAEVGGGALTEALLASLHFRAHDDAAAALQDVRAAGIERVVVVSNWDCSLPEVLERVGLMPWLDGVVSSAAVGAAKPDPEIFRRGLRLAGASPADAVHVGDSLAEDVTGARAAGVAPVLIAREQRPAVDPGCPVLDSLADLRPLLRAYPG